MCRDFQVWCGPAIGALNAFIAGTFLDHRVSGEYPCVVQLNMHVLAGARLGRGAGAYVPERSIL